MEKMREPFISKGGWARLALIVLSIWAYSELSATLEPVLNKYLGW
jgi:hypothetical protein